MAWLVGSYWNLFFLFERKMGKESGSGQCLLWWWWWFVFESMVFGDVDFWVCDSQE